MSKYRSDAPAFGARRNAWLRVPSGQSYHLLKEDADAIIELEKERDALKKQLERINEK